jgi:hypothetical protein
MRSRHRHPARGQHPPAGPGPVSGQIGPGRRTPDWPSPRGEQSPLAELTRTWSPRSPWEDHRPAIAAGQQRRRAAARQPGASSRSVRQPCPRAPRPAASSWPAAPRSTHGRRQAATPPIADAHAAGQQGSSFGHNTETARTEPVQRIAKSSQCLHVNTSLARLGVTHPALPSCATHLSSHEQQRLDAGDPPVDTAVIVHR